MVGLKMNRRNARKANTGRSSGRAARVALLSVSAIGACPALTSAADFTWASTTATNGSWSVGTNWVGGSVPTFDTTTALFFNAAGFRTTTGGGAFGFITTHNAGSVQLNSLNFANIGNASISLAFSTSTLQFGGAGAAINNLGTGSIDLGGTGAIRFDSVGLTIGGGGIGTTNISGTLGGTQGLTIDRSGISSSGYMGAYVNIATGQTFTGPGGVHTTLNNGILNIATQSLGATGGTFAVNGGFLRTSVSTTLAAYTFSIGSGGLNIVTPLNLTVGSSGTWTGVGGVQLRQTNGLIELQANMQYSGSTLFYPLAQTGNSAGSFGSVISTGSFVVSGLNGRLSNTSSVTVHNGLMQFGTNGSGNNDRIPDATPFSLHNGTIVMTGTSTAGTPQTETLAGTSGALSTFSGQNLIQAAPTISSAQITLAGFTRLTNSTFVFRGSNLGQAAGAGTGNIFLSPAPLLLGGGGVPGSTNISIIPWAVGGGTNSATGSTDIGTTLVTYDVNGVRPLTAAEYATYAAGTPIDNVRVTAGAVGQAPKIFNALQFENGGTTGYTFLGDGTGPLLVASGAMILQNNNVSTSGSITLGGYTAVGAPAGTDLYIHASGGSSAPTAGYTITSPLSGAQLIKAGRGILTLTNPVSGITGDVTINGGQLFVYADSSLGGGTDVNLMGGALGWAIPGNTLSTRNFKAGPGGASYHIAGGATLTLANPLDAIPGTTGGGLFKSGKGVLRLTQPSTYTGYTSVDLGALEISNPNQINIGTFIQINGNLGTELRLNGSFTLPNDIVLNQSTVASGPGVGVTAGNTATLTGMISGVSNGAQAFSKFGLGTLVLTNTHPLNGGLNVLEGNLVLAGANGALPNATQGNSFSLNGVIADRSSSFTLDNSAAVNNNRLGENVLVTMNAGSVNLIGNASANTLENIGTLSGAFGTLTVAASGTGNTRLNVGTITLPSIWMIRGTNLGNTPLGTPGAAHFTVASIGGTVNAAFSGQGATIGADANTPQALVLTRIAGDDSATGPGKNFLTMDTNLSVRLLNALEQTNTFTPGGTLLSNVTTAGGLTNVSRPTLVNSLLVTNGGSVNGPGQIRSNALMIIQQAGSGTLNNAVTSVPLGNNFGVWTAGDLTVNGDLTGSLALFKSGPGELTLNGNMVIGGTSTVSVLGGTLTVSATGTIPQASALNIPDVAFVNLAGADRTISGIAGAGNVALTNGGGTINIGANNLTVGAAGTTTSSNSVIIGTGGLTMTFGGSGAGGTQTFSKTQLYFGPTTINAGTVQLAGQFGALANTSTINLNGGTLIADNSNSGGLNTFNGDRLPDTAPINLSGNLTLVGDVTMPTNEVVGPINHVGGGVITISAGSTAPARITASSYNRPANGGTGLVRGANLGNVAGVPLTSSMFFTSAPTLVGGGGLDGTTTVSIIPSLIGDRSAAGVGTDFVTYNASRGVRPLDVTEYGPLVTAGGVGTQVDAGSSAPTVNAILNSAVTFTGTTTVNSLKIDTGAAPTGAGTITPASGAVLSTATTTLATGGPTLDFGAGEGIIHVAANVLTVNSPIFGSGGLTKGGAGTLILGGVNNVGAYTGVTRINDGVLQITNAANLGPGDIVLALGNGVTTSTRGLNITATTGTIPNNIILGGGFQNLATAAGASIEFSGNISGSGGLQLNSGTFVFSGTNTFTGPIKLFLNAGTILLSNDNNLGIGGDITWEGGNIRLTTGNDWTTSRRMWVNFGGSNIDTNGQQATFNGGIHGVSTGALNKVGAGTLILNAHSTTPAAINVNAGALRVRNNFALGSPQTATTVASGAQLQFDNNIFMPDEPLSIAGTGLSSTGAILNFGGNNIHSGTVTLTAASSIGANASSMLTLAGNITGAFGLTKVGAGTLRTWGHTTYTGGTTVNGGTFLVSNVVGSGAGTGSVNVNTGATLGGNGAFTGAANINPGGTLAPGESIGTLRTGTLTLGTSSTPHAFFDLEFDIDANAADLADVVGTVSLDRVDLVFSLAAPITSAPGSKTFIVIRNDGSDSVNRTVNSFASATGIMGQLLAYAVDFDYSGTDARGLIGDGNDVAITLTYVPEPNSLLVLSAGGLLLGRRRRS